jgi:hypothetical protein
MTKNYYVMYGIGKCRYVVNFHDGEKTHTDGSEFYDVHIVSNKRELSGFVAELRASGYSER